MKKYLFGFFLFWLSICAFADPVETNHARVSLLPEYQTITPGQDFWVAFKIQTQPGWHVYWKNPGDSGMPPKLHWQLPKGMTADHIKWLPPKRFRVSQLMNYGYEGNAYFLVKIKNESTQINQSVTLAAKADWLICSENCVPETADLSVTMTVAEQSELSVDNAEVSAALDKLSSISSIQGIASLNEKKISIRLPKAKLSSHDIKSVYFFAEEEGYVIAADEQKWSDETDNLEIRLSRDFSTPHHAVKGLLEVKSDLSTDYYSVNAEFEPGMISDEMEYGLVMMLLMAFIGGIILNAMPCVFPVLSLKALAIAKKAHEDPKQVRLHSVAYTAGVVMSFLSLAMTLIILKYAGHTIGWGYQLQSPHFVVLLILVLFLVGLNLSGVFEIQWMFAGGAIADRTDWIGSFMTGVLATVVATPCTAPFMATAVGYALTETGLHTVAVFISLGLGLSFPFLMISFFPKSIRWLPKPGQWMVTLRQLLAFPIYLTCVWLLWVLAQQVTHNEVAVVLASLVFLTMYVWLGTVGQKGILRQGARLVLLVLVLMPFYSAFWVYSQEDEIPYSPQTLHKLQQEGKTVFVHATAAWCITCKANELLVLSKPNVQQVFKESGITLMKADWTNQDPEITHYLEQFNRSGVPLYVFYSKDKEPKILPQILTQSIVLEAIKNTQ